MRMDLKSVKTASGSKNYNFRILELLEEEVSILLVENHADEL